MHENQDLVRLAGGLHFLPTRAIDLPSGIWDTSRYVHLTAPLVSRPRDRAERVLSFRYLL